MWNNVVGEAIRRASRNLLSVNALLVAAILIAGVANSRYLYNAVFGPFPADERALVAVTQPASTQQYFVTVRSDARADTGVQQVSRRVSKATGAVTSERVSASYLVVRIGEHLMVVKAPGHGGGGAELTGALVSIPDSVRARILDEMLRERPDLRERFFPFMLDAGDFQSGAWWGLGIGVPLLGLGLWNCKRAAAYRGDPATHPIARGLAGYGPPAEVAARIDGEMRTAEQIGSGRLSQSWLLSLTFFGATLLRLEDLAWVYRKVTRHYIYLVIPTGKSHAVILHRRDGVAREIPGKDEVVGRWLEAIAQRVPWVMFGFDAQMQAQWKANRAAFVAAVDERRRKTPA